MTDDRGACAVCRHRQGSVYRSRGSADAARSHGRLVGLPLCRALRRPLELLPRRAIDLTTGKGEYALYFPAPGQRLAQRPPYSGGSSGSWITMPTLTCSVQGAGNSLHVARAVASFLIIHCSEYGAGTFMCDGATKSACSSPRQRFVRSRWCSRRGCGSRTLSPRLVGRRSARRGRQSPRLSSPER